MGTDKNTIQQNAQLFASRGQFDKAIAEWKKLTTGVPTDSIIYNTIGDLHLKRNAPAEAVQAYLQAGAAFHAGGGALQAIAVYRKILKINPAFYKAYQYLGDLNAERGLVSNAVSDYLTVSKIYLKEGRIQEALELYRTIAKLDPSNLEAKQRLAELGPRERVQDKSAEQPDPLPRLEKAPTEVQRPTPAPSSPSQQASEGPKELGRPGLLEAAEKQIKNGQYADAESVLTELLDRMPGDPEVCRLLAMLHLRRGDLAVAMAEIRFLAESAMRAQDYALAESMISEYLQTDPTCVTLIELLGRVYQQKGDKTAEALQYGNAIAELLEHPDPDMPTLPAELYADIKILAPSSPFVSQFAPAFEPAPLCQEAPSGQEPAESERPSKQESAAQLDSQVAPAVEAEQLHQEAPSVQTPAEPERPSEQDYKTQYELGIAFKNMGLLNEAIEEFRFAINGTACFLDACSMLAACLKEQGMTKEAIASLEQALADPRCAEDTSVAVRYELGSLYEAEGLYDQAVLIFSTIPTFLDVPIRLKRIKDGGQTGDSFSAVGDRTTAPAGDAAVPQQKKRRLSHR
ncbi:MAG: tetratricopeptide repeat protein [Nitrospirota bacterium]